jgi:hypothetical protein
MFAANELSWVNEQIEAIKPSRQGISNQSISMLKDPFIFLHSKKKIHTSYKKHSNKTSPKKIHKHSSKIFLEAILNKNALINGKWYKEGEKVYGYTIKKVNLKSVLLTRGKKQLLLSTMSKSNNLKFNNK